MAQLAQSQSKAVDAYVEICSKDQYGMLGPLFGPEFQQLWHKIQSVKPWGEFLTQSDFFYILLRLLGRHTLALPKEYIGLLRSAPDGVDIGCRFKDDLINYLESLPRPYHVYFPLVGAPPIGRAELMLADRVALVDTSVSEDLDPRLLQQDFGALARALLPIDRLRLEQNVRYIRFEIAGYANELLSSPVAASALAQLKHFLFIGLARGVLKEVPSWMRSDSIVARAIHPAVLIRHGSCDEDECYVLSLPDDLYRFLLSVEVKPDILSFDAHIEGQTVLGSFEKRAPSTPEELGLAVKQCLGGSTAFFNIPRDDRDAVRIKAAIEWWIDAVVSQNQTISFLQYCLGFEALLGDSVSGPQANRERGVTERLADRFAYLRGHTQTARDEHRREFVKVYQRRGVIVHQRETHLRGSEDADACIRARSMLFGAITDELNALMVSRKSEPTSIRVDM